MEDDLSSFSSSEIASLTTLSFDQAMLSILNDYRYQLKFNQFMKESEPTRDSWRRTEWFGFFIDITYPWIYHEDLGWLFYGHATSSDGFWAYSEGLGWWWSNKTQFSLDSSNGKNNRYIFLSKENNWVALDFSKAPPTKRYYSYNLGEYISF